MVSWAAQGSPKGQPRKKKWAAQKGSPNSTRAALGVPAGSRRVRVCPGGRPEIFFSSRHLTLDGLLTSYSLAPPLTASHLPWINPEAPEWYSFHHGRRCGNQWSRWRHPHPAVRNNLCVTQPRSHHLLLTRNTPPEQEDAHPPHLALRRSTSHQTVPTHTSSHHACTFALTRISSHRLALTSH